jgi:hypothetical protein
MVSSPVAKTTACLRGAERESRILLLNSHEFERKLQDAVCGIDVQTANIAIASVPMP